MSNILREKIAAIFWEFQSDEFLGPKAAADRILALPELKRALELLDKSDA